MTPSVKLQLTKDKTIEIRLPGGGGAAGASGKGKGASDIVGVELFSDNPEGCPAVRLVYRKKHWHLAAAEFIPAPEGDMPERWDDVPKQPTWAVPKRFFAPHAALAVNSSQSAFAQGTSDAVTNAMSGALGSAPAAAAEPAAKKRFGIKHAASAAPADPSASAQQSASKADLPAAGVPVSENGRRFVLKPLAEEGLHLYASLPEFQSLWLSRLLPEGKRPTASSVQLAESALLASILAQPTLKELEGNALVIFVRRDSVSIAGYKGGAPVLFRRCPGVLGYEAMEKAVVTTLSVGEDLVEAVLNESLIDPRPALEPFVHPILAQLDLSRAYLAGKHGLTFDKALLIGLPAGAQHWSVYAEEFLKIKLIAPNPLDGLEIDKGVDVKNPNGFLVAIGAALAAAEVEL